MSSQPPFMMPPMMPGMGPPGAGGGGTQTVVVYNISVPAPQPPKTQSFAFCCSGFVLRPLLALLLWAGWVIYIAGTSKLQNLCNAGMLYPGVPLLDDPNKQAIVDLQQPMTSGGCVTYLGLLWWSVWLQFTTILLLTVTGLTMHVGLPGTKGFLNTCLYFFIMSTILLFFQANDYQTANYLFRNGFYSGADETDWKTACTLTVVGAVVTLIFNFIYIIWNTHSEPGSSSSGIPAGMPPQMMGPHMGPPPHTDGDAFIIPGEDKPKPLHSAAATHTPVTHTAAATPITAPAPTVVQHADPEVELASARPPTTAAPTIVPHTVPEAPTTSTATPAVLAPHTAAVTPAKTTAPTVLPVATTETSAKPASSIPSAPAAAEAVKPVTEITK